MDPNLIYKKTASGDEAMRQRTRVVQRNMRMVLILVDGKATVADLCAKTTNVSLTESALRDLEKGGFVEPLMERDSVWEQSKKVAQEIKAAALSHAFSSPSSSARKEEVRAEPSFAPAPAPFVKDVVDSSFSAFSSFSVAPVHSPEKTGSNKISVFGVESVLNLPKPSFEEKTPALRDRLKALFPPRDSRQVNDDYSIKPIRRGGERYHLTWPRILIFGVPGLLVTILLVAILFPYGSYLPEAEAELSKATGQPAKVGEMRVSFYPKPGLFLSNVRLGSADDGKVIRISEMRLLPVLGTITTPRKIFREVELNGLTLPAEALIGLSEIFDAAAQPSASVGIQHVTLEKTDISFHGLALSELNGEVKLMADGRFDSLALYSPDRSLYFEAKPAAAGMDIALEAYGWHPLPASLFIFDSGTIKGNLNGATFVSNKIELHIFDGFVQGSALLRADKQQSMTGEISFERISARRFGEALGIGPQFEGETAGKLKFVATADSWSSIFSGINADGSFTMRRGLLGAIDLTEAVRRTSAAPTRGGSTRFEQLSGRLRLTPDSYRFSDLALSSGLMQSVGQMTVSKDLQVNGSMEVQMRGTVNQLRMPVSISGALKAPLLQAGKR